MERCVNDRVTLARGGDPPGSAQRRKGLCYSILASVGAALHPHPTSQRCINTKFSRRKYLLLPHQTMTFC